MSLSFSLLREGETETDERRQPFSSFLMKQAAPRAEEQLGQEEVMASGKVHKPGESGWSVIRKNKSHLC